MSSAINRRKRSHRGERDKQSTFGAGRRAYGSAEYQKKDGQFRSLFQRFKRNTASERAGKQREARTNDGI